MKDDIFPDQVTPKPRKVERVEVYIGNSVYGLVEIPANNTLLPMTSSFPQYYWQTGNEIVIWPELNPPYQIRIERGDTITINDVLSTP